MKGSGRFKLHKKEILRGKNNFNRLFQKGRSVTGRYLKVLYVPNGTGTDRIAVCVGKRTGKSHFRNRIRRVIKEIIRQNKADLGQGRDLAVVLLKRKFEEMAFADKKKEVLSCLRRIPRDGPEVTSAVCYNFSKQN